MTATAEAGSAAGDRGYFPAGSSMLRRIHGEKAVGLMYGQRALGIGALSPVNFIGTRNHTNSLDRPFRRLVRTANMFETVFFGSRAEADRVLKIVAGMHGRVEGSVAATDAERTLEAGTPYSAFDPEMMLWTIGVMADSAVVLHELLVAALTAQEKEAFWQDYLLLGELFGMPRETAPQTWPAFKAWLHARIASDDFFLTEQARYVGYSTMFRIPTTGPTRYGMRAHNLVLRGSLPETVRQKYGLSWTPLNQRMMDALVVTSKAARPLLPAGRKWGYNTAEFADVERAEDAIIASGARPPGALA